MLHVIPLIQHKKIANNLHGMHTTHIISSMRWWWVMWGCERGDDGDYVRLVATHSILILSCLQDRQANTRLAYQTTNIFSKKKVDIQQTIKRYRELWLNHFELLSRSFSCYQSREKCGEQVASSRGTLFLTLNLSALAKKQIKIGTLFKETKIFGLFLC